MKRTISLIAVLTFLSITASAQLRSSASSRDVKVDDVKVRFWWWPEKVARAGFDGNDPPPKNQYLDLTRWQYDGEGITTSPHKIDVIAKLSNRSGRSFTGKIRVVLSAKFLKSTRLCGAGKWTASPPVLSEAVTIAQGRTRTIKSANYSLHTLLDRQHHGQAVCSMSFTVEVLDRSKNVVTSTSKTIPIVMDL